VSPDLPFPTRVWFAFACFFRVLTSGSFAGAAWRLRTGGERPPEPAPALASPPAPAPEPPPAPSNSAALQLLALFQREGRLVDFLEQDIASFSDADVGAAARVVHDGCRRALRAHATLAPVRFEEEDARVTVAEGFLPEEIKLTGKVGGAAPFAGVLRHRGWRVRDLTLPTVVRAHDMTVVAPAEVELS
jgi:hypothetical protein